MAKNNVRVVRSDANDDEQYVTPQLSTNSLISFLS